MGLIFLQFKSPGLIKFYIITLLSILGVGLFLFVFHAKFRQFIIHYVKNHKFFVVLFIAFYLTYLITRLFFVERVFPFLFDEDGFFEYMTTLFFLIASAFFILALSKRYGSITPYTRLFIFGLGLFCFVVGMEEISWGQRIFGIETPEPYKQINFQGETTVHNLVSPDYHPILYAVVSFILLIFFAFSNSKYNSLLGIHKRYFPSKKFLVVALLLPLISLYNMEHFEVILSFMFCVYGFQLWNEGSIFVPLKVN